MAGGESASQVERTPQEILDMVDRLEDLIGTRAHADGHAGITAAYVAACVLRWTLGERWPGWMSVHPADARPIQRDDQAP